MQQALEHFEDALLGRHVEVDQQVATEHEVIQAIAAGQQRVEHIAYLQADLLAYPLVQAVAFVDHIEVTLAKTQLAAAKGIAAIHGLPGLGHRAGADVHAIDQERPRRHTGIKQGHGQRIGLLARRARQAEQPQRPRAVQFGTALVRQGRQRGEGLGVPEEPGLWHDHRFDQCLLLFTGLLQAQPVVVQIGSAHRYAALAQGTLDHRRADRLHIQANTLTQETEKTLFGHVGPPVGPCVYSNACTASGSRSLTSMRCSMPRAS